MLCLPSLAVISSDNFLQEDDGYLNATFSAFCWWRELQESQIVNNGEKTGDIKAVFLVIIILKLKGDIFIKIKDDEKMIKGHVQ